MLKIQRSASPVNIKGVKFNIVSQKRTQGGKEVRGSPYRAARLLSTFFPIGEKQRRLGSPAGIGKGSISY